MFVDSALQPRWLVDAFARVAASGFATIAVIALVGERREALPWSFKLYRHVDRWAFSAEPAEQVALSQHVPHERFLAAAARSELAALELDVAFALGDYDDSQLDGLARHGVWRFYFGAEGAEQESLAGFREVVDGEALIRCGLKVRRGPGAAVRLAYESWSRTYPVSVARNRAHLLRKCAEFAYRALRELYHCGAGWLDACPSAQHSAQPRNRAGAAPTLGDVVRIGGRVAHRGLMRSLYREQWFLAFRFGGGRNGVRGDLAGFTRIMPPKDRDWADPFALERNGRYYVFFEELPYAAGKGHISMLEIRPDGRPSPVVRVLERDYHLSYPFLLEHGGTLYMIPETAQSRSVEIYRCIEFPLRWTLERKLMEGVRYVDPTLHRAAERWWMFANAAPGESPVFEDELHIFHAEALLGDWKPHARNPVKSDARSARPGGQIYRQDGALYRPSQVCVPRYGAGICINRIERLTPEEYAERQVKTVLPAEAQGILGLHTVNCAGALTVIDGCVRRART